MPAPYDYSSITGYARTRADWADFPSTATPITQAQLDQFDQAIKDLKSVTFNVKDFGAKGDFATDDTTTIQAALDTANSAGGGIVHMPAGNYLHSQIKYGSNVVLQGAGANLTVLYQTSGTALPMLVSRDNTVTQQNVVIRDIGLTGFNNQTSSTGGILFEKTLFSRCENVEVTFSKNYAFKALGGTAGGDCMYNTWRGCIVQNMVSGTAFLLASSSSSSPDGFLVIDCTINSAAGTAFQVDKGAAARGYGADGVFLANRAVEVPTVFNIDGNDVRIAFNRFEKTSGAVAATIAATAFRTVRAGNIYAAPSGLTLTDSSPTSTNHSASMFEDIGSLSGATVVVNPLAYSATIATDTNTGNVFPIVATNGTAFTISNPTNAALGKAVTYDIKNSSGGAMGAITWGAAFLLAGAFTNPANTKRRTITFYYDGTNWIETNRAAADI